MSKADFDAACARRGFTPAYLGNGYYHVPDENGKPSTCISILNAPNNRRAQLAYLIAEHKKSLEWRANQKVLCAEIVEARKAGDLERYNKLRIKAGFKAVESIPKFNSEE